MSTILSNVNFPLTVSLTTYSNAAALAAATTTTLRQGHKAVVSGAGIYALDQNSTAIVDNITYIAALNGGNWVFWGGPSVILTSANTLDQSQSPVQYFDIVIPVATLASAGKAIVVAGRTNVQYYIRNIIVNYSAAGLSGSSGNRLLVLTDGTTVFNNAGITAALLGTPVNTLWGGSGNPIAGTVAQNTLSVLGAPLYFQYSGGTTDYSAGSISLTVVTEIIVP